MSEKLTDKQEAFCIEYVANNGNATEAARRAGYNDNGGDSIRSMGYENLTKPHIIARIQQIRDESGIDSAITLEWLLSYAKSNVERSMQEEKVYDSEGNFNGEFKYNGNVANKSLELIAKIKGWMDLKEKEKPKENKTPEQIYLENLRLLGYSEERIQEELAKQKTAS